MACVRRIRSLQEIILQQYEPWLCNVWARSEYACVLHGLDVQMYAIMQDVFKYKIPSFVTQDDSRKKIFRLMKIRRYLKIRPEKLMQIAHIYHQRFHS